MSYAVRRAAAQSDRTKIKNESPEKIRADLQRSLPRMTWRLLLTIVVAVAVLGWGLQGTNASPQALVEGIPNILDFISRLMPPEFEFVEGSEITISFNPLSSRPTEQVNPTENLERLRPATEEDLAAVTEDQQVVTLYRGPERRWKFSPEEVEGEIDEASFIIGTGQYIHVDVRSGHPFALDEGTVFVEEYALAEGEQLIAGRYVIQNGEIFLGWPSILGAIVETVQMAIIGTVGAVILAIPFGLLAARNVSPAPIVYQITRLLLNANRAIPEIVYALILVAAVGLGPFAGVVALVIGSIGGMGKLYAESIEAIDPAQVAAVRATGAGPLQVFNYGVIPQAFPLMASYSLLLFEGNIRAATILGIVGAGGVGLIIQKYLALFQYQRLMGAVLVIIIVVTIIDRLSDAVRKRII